MVYNGNIPSPTNAVQHVLSQICDNGNIPLPTNAVQHVISQICGNENGALGHQQQQATQPLKINIADCITPSLLCN